MNNFEYFILEAELPKNIFESDAKAYQVIVSYNKKIAEKAQRLFKHSLQLKDIKKDKLITRAYKHGVSNPMAESLRLALKESDDFLRVDQWIFYSEELSSKKKQKLKYLWREPAIEELFFENSEAWLKRNQTKPKVIERPDPSWQVAPASDFGLEFNSEELKAIALYQEKENRDLNRAELEVLAQSWSEHCKHKIFAAHIECQDLQNTKTDSLFKSHIKAVTDDILERDPKRALSVFHDNAGVLPLYDCDGGDTDWAYCLKMETHNSPSAIAPYGGASTGIVGVHRDILGTGQGAMPIANWDVLCFESPEHNEERPENALPADLLRTGVIRGIEEGGNQSGIPTMQGSVVFDPAYAVKPLVYAGSIGLLPKNRSHKKPNCGMKLFCFGGAVGIDGLRGAVMSSRDLREEDFVGSAVQVANAFVQRRLTDFLLEARDLDLIPVVTDNGAGGLSSSVGEMATLTNGATIDLSQLRTKYQGLHGWERLLSESQERMTLATDRPAELIKLAQKWQIPYDELGELNDGGYFYVRYQDKDLVKLSLQFLHESCPRLNLKSSWSRKEDLKWQEAKQLPEQNPKWNEDFSFMLNSPHLCSREGIVRRYDHEVQGRTRQLPFQGLSQNSPADASVIEVYEAKKSAIVLSHGLAPWRSDTLENVLSSFDECVRSAVLNGGRLSTAGMLDNFCWPDPIGAKSNPGADRRLWRLQRSCEVLSTLCRAFDIPLISGKDSMKNNSADFEIPETLVISLGASSVGLEKIPTSFFTRANDVLFYLAPHCLSLRESVWERSFNKRSAQHSRRWLKAENQAQESAELADLIERLKLRYKSLAALVETGLVRSAKDIGEGGLLTALFEKSLGRNMGVWLDDTVPASVSDQNLFFLGEGLGGVILSVDPHQVDEAEKTMPELQRLGVVTKSFELRIKDECYDFAPWKESYLKKGNEGFWND